MDAKELDRNQQQVLSEVGLQSLFLSFIIFVSGYLRFSWIACDWIASTEIYLSNIIIEVFLSRFLSNPQVPPGVWRSRPARFQRWLSTALACRYSVTNYLVDQFPSQLSFDFFCLVLVVCSKEFQSRTSWKDAARSKLCMSGTDDLSSSIRTFPRNFSTCSGARRTLSTKYSATGNRLECWRTIIRWASAVRTNSAVPVRKSSISVVLARIRTYRCMISSVKVLINAYGRTDMRGLLSSVTRRDYLQFIVYQSEMNARSMRRASTGESAEPVSGKMIMIVDMDQLSYSQFTNKLGNFSFIYLFIYFNTF